MSNVYFNINIWTFGDIVRNKLKYEKGQKFSLPYQWYPNKENVNYDDRTMSLQVPWIVKEFLYNSLSKIVEIAFTF